MENMRLLLINVIDTKRPVETSLQPLGLAYLASYLRSHMDGLTIKISHACSEKTLETFQPDIVGLSSVTQNFHKAKQLARFCKSRGHVVIVGGVHITLMPHTLTPDMDLGVCGEGEETFLEVVRKLKQEGFERNGFQEIPGLVFRDENGGLRQTERRPQIDPLDRIPFPARELLYKKAGNIFLMSSRGCPFNCRFCSSSEFWTSSRYFSSGYVVAEIRSVLDRYQPTHISFWDDLFGVNKQRLRDMIAEMKNLNIPASTTFSATCRAERVDEELVRLLKQMNVTQVALGLESGSDRILKELKGGTASVARNAAAVRLLDQQGIQPVGSFCIGSPQETEEDLRETLSFIREMPLAKLGVFVLTPLPGTELWEWAKKKGKVSDDMPWENLFMDLNHNPHKVIVAERIPRKTLVRWYYRLRREALIKSVLYTLKRFLKNPRSLPASAHRRLFVLKDHLTKRLFA